MLDWGMPSRQHPVVRENRERTLRTHCLAVGVFDWGAVHRDLGILRSASWENCWRHADCLHACELPVHLHMRVLWPLHAAGSCLASRPGLHSDIFGRSAIVHGLRVFLSVGVGLGPMM